jgi:serine protease Do
LPQAPDIADLVERVRPAVVNITATHEIALPREVWPLALPWGGDEVLRERALGSGFIVDHDGHVATNAHVVDQADVVQIKLADDRNFRAKVIGKDEPLDVAVLAIEAPPADLPVASLGSSERIRVGDYVVAIGNPLGLGDTVTMGIVSAKGRSLGAGPYDDFIQTDAPINPGNSGGPLFDVHGQVVGINTAIASRAQGIGFAVPIDPVKRELPQLIANGRVARGRLGVAIRSIDEALASALGLDHAQGALVARVVPGGPADQAGVRAGDLIVAVDGQDVKDAADLPRLIEADQPGTHVRLTLIRNGRKLDFDVVLGAIKRTPEGATSKQQP